MPLHSDDRSLFTRLLYTDALASSADVLAFYDALAEYHDGDDPLLASALSLILSTGFASSRRADDALERFIRDFDRPALVDAASSILTERWLGLANGEPLGGVTSKRALRLARTHEDVHPAHRFTWAWLARPGGLREAGRIADGAELGLDVLDPVFPPLLGGELDEDEVALIESLLLHASWIARRVLLTQIDGVAHAPLLPALALMSSSADPTTALALVGAFRRIGHPAAEHALVTILLKPDPGPDLSILEVLAEIGSPTYLDTLRAFGEEAPDVQTRAAAAAAVDAIIERASLGGGALTLVDNGELTGALSPSGAAGSGALSDPNERAPGTPAHEESPPLEREPSPRVALVDPMHALVRRRVDEGAALTTASSRDLVQRSWLDLAPAPRRVPRFFMLTDSPLLLAAVGGVGASLLSAAVFPVLAIMAAWFFFPALLLVALMRGGEFIASPWLHGRLLRRGLPTLARILRYDTMRRGYVISFITDDNVRVESVVHAVEGDARFGDPIQPMLYDPDSHDAELFELIEGVEIAPDGQLVPCASAIVYRNMSLSLLVLGAVAFVLSLLM